MSVIAESRIEGGFVLSELLEELPDVRIQLEQIVRPQDADRELTDGATTGCRA
jgi:hypothetical protein